VKKEADRAEGKHSSSLLILALLMQRWQDRDNKLSKRYRRGSRLWKKKQNNKENSRQLMMPR
jgi:hypothetical protein